MTLKNSLIFVKILILLMGSFAMLFAVSFNLLSKDQLEALMQENFWSFFFIKYGVGFTAGLLFYILSLFTNLIFRKKHGFEKQKIIKLALFELGFVFVFPLLITILFIKCI